MTEAIHIIDMYISGKFLPWKFTYLLNSMRKIFVCCYNDFEFKVYILHFAYAIHGTHHNLVNKMWYKNSQDFVAWLYSKKHCYLSFSFKKWKFNFLQNYLFPSWAQFECTCKVFKEQNANSQLSIIQDWSSGL